MAEGNKIASCAWEEDIIEKMVFKSWPTLKICEWLKKEKGYRASYSTLQSYRNNILPAISKERISQIRSKLETSKTQQEEHLIKRLQELENSMEYLVELENNLKFIRVEKQRAMASLIEIRTEYNTWKNSIDLKRCEKEPTFKDEIAKKEIEYQFSMKKLESDITSGIFGEDKLTKTMHNIRIDLNKELGERWDQKIKEIIDDVSINITDALIPSLKDSERKEAAERAQKVIEILYSRYGVEEKNG